MLPDLHNLPLHTQWVCGLLIVSFLLCLLVGLGGMACRRLWGTPSPTPLYSGFPACGDVAYTILFIAYFVFSSIVFAAITGTSAAANAEEKLLSDFEALLINIAVTGALYIPMLVRMKQLPAHDELLPTAVPGGYLPQLPHLPRLPHRPLSLALVMRELAMALIAILFVVTFTLVYENCGLKQLIVDTTGSPENQDIVNVFTSGGWDIRLLIIIGAVIIAPIGEECCFRGFLYGILRHSSGRLAAALCSSLLFAAVHTSLTSMLPLFIFALAQCYLYEKTRSLRAPIIMHALFNALELALTYMLSPHA